MTGAGGALTCFTFGFFLTCTVVVMVLTTGFGAAGDEAGAVAGEAGARASAPLCDEGAESGAVGGRGGGTARVSCARDGASRSRVTRLFRDRPSLPMESFE